MRFFIPGANDVSHGEQLYRETRDQLKGVFAQVSDRRICRLKFSCDGTTVNVAVGDSFPFKDGQPVFAIYETESVFVVLTSAYGPPKLEEAQMVPADRAIEVEEFTAIA